MDREIPDENVSIDESSPSVETSPPSNPDEPSLLRSSTKLELKNTRVTCAACRNDTIAIGTIASTVLFFDAATFKDIGRFQSGTKGTFALDFDRSGTFIVSSDRDGKISVRQLVRRTIANRIDAEEKHSATFFVQESFPLRVAIDPLAYSQTDYAFVSGGSEGRPLLTKKTWFASSSTDVANPGYSEGPINKIGWRNDLVVWTITSGAIRLRDIKRNVWIAITPENALEDDKVDDFFWENDETLLLASDWAVKVLKFKRNISSSIQTAVISLTVETTSPLNYVIPFGGTNGSILTIGADGLARLIDRMSEVVLASLWLVPMESPSALKPVTVIFHDDYWASPVVMDEASNSTLLPLQKKTVQEETSLPFLYAFHNTVSNDGIQAELVVMRSRTIEDVLQHALSVHDYEKAMKIARGAHSENWCSMSESDVGDAYMAYLLGQKKYDVIADVMPRAFSQNDAQSWTKWGAVLAERREIGRIVDTMPPTGLPGALYDAALSQILEKGGEEDERYLQLVRRFLNRIDPNRCVEEIKDRLRNGGESPALQKALALVYSAIPERVEEGFWAMLDAQSIDAFQVLESRQEGVSLLLKVLENGRAPELCKLDETRFLSLVLPLAGSLSILTSSTAFTEEDSIAFAQLFPGLVEELCKTGQERPALRLLRKWNSTRRTTENTKNQNVDLCDLEVELCARIDSPRLLELLRDSNGYSPEKALLICRENPKLRMETVFLLQRMGGPKHTREALEIIAYEFNDLDMALEYAEREDLFDELVKVCVAPKAPTTLAVELLSRAGSYSIDPACLVRALPAGLQEVRPRLIKLFRDVRANLATRSVANEIFANAAAQTANRTQKQFSKAIRVRPRMQSCAWCKRLLSDGMSQLVVFRSGDAYHESCLREAWETLFKHSAASDDLLISGAELTQSSLLKLHATEYTNYFESS